jgi:hypothetical protein
LSGATFASFPGPTFYRLGAALRAECLDGGEDLVAAKANPEHPALVYVFEQLQAMIDAARNYQRPHNLRPLDWSSRLSHELRRLHDGGITGQEVFRVVALVWMLHRYQPRTLPAGRPLLFAMARAVLDLRPRYTHVGIRRERSGPALVSNRLSTLVVAKLGEELLTLLHPVLARMAEAIDRATTPQQEQRAKIVQALDEQPFT